MIRYYLEFNRKWIDSFNSDFRNPTIVQIEKFISPDQNIFQKIEFMYSGRIHCSWVKQVWKEEID